MNVVVLDAQQSKNTAGVQKEPTPTKEKSDEPDDITSPGIRGSECMVDPQPARQELLQRNVWSTHKCLSKHRVQLCVLDTQENRKAIAKQPLRLTSVAVADGGTATPEQHAKAPVVLRWFTPAEAAVYEERVLAALSVIAAKSHLPGIILNADFGSPKENAKRKDK
jgi:hypothetical protein